MVRKMSTVQVPKEELVNRARSFNEDAVWFEENLDAGENLRRKYPESYIAIREKRVVDSDKDIRKLLTRLSRKYGSNEIGAIFIEYVTKTKIALII